MTTQALRRQSRDYANVQSLMSQFFGDREWGTWPSFRSEGLANWTPAVDVREGNESFVFTADLPGLDKGDVDVTFEDKVLTISGDRALDESDDSGPIRRLERRYGKFSRSFSLPGQVDADQVEGSFSNGVLTVRVPKAEAAKARKIKLG